MHLAIRKKSHQVQGFPSVPGAINCREQELVAEKLSGGNIVINPRHIHPDHAACADVQMAHFGIAHHSTRQTDASA
jgi:hypothetical protein